LGVGARRLHRPAAIATHQPSPVVKPDATTELKQAKSVYDQGLINKDDYDGKMKKILDSMELKSNSRI
jgi:hypothetical protein